MYYHSNYNKYNRGGKWEKIVNTAVGWVKNFIRSMRTKFFSKWTWRKTFKYSLLLAAFGLISGSILFFVVSLSLPNPNKLSTRVVPQSTKIYARDGTTLLYEIHGEAKRTLVELNDIPQYMREATIAIEDKDFYHNNGVDIQGIFRAVFKNVTSGDLTGQGGSTITQQFVKNAILTNEKTFTRKIKEAVLAIQIEQKFTKDEILKLYLNEIPYGQNAYGVEAAAQTYFSKHAKDITLAEAAYLAAIPQAPSFYSPFGTHRDRLDARKNLVLEEMEKQGYISREDKEKAQAEVVAFNKIKTAIKAPHFVLYVQELLAEEYGEKTLEEGGLNVVTTLDWRLQEIAEKAVKDGVARNEKNYRAENASLVAIDPKTGHILAMVGSRDYFDDAHDGQVNVALRPRQPGSSFKPYVYATAFKEGMSPATMLMDVKMSFGTYGGKDYSPGNYDGVSHGPLSIRKAFAGSLNVPAVKTLFLTGVQDAIDTAKDLGITSDLSADVCGLSLVLGGCEVMLLDHVSAMGVFATMGVKHDHTPILKITDSKGKVLEEYKEAGREAIDPQVAYQVVDIMTDNDSRAFVFGSRSPLILPDRPVGAKTGTTQQWKDGWTLGYTPSLVAGVWAGNNKGELMRAGADGVLVAAPIWNQFMREATKDTPVEQFQEPEGIQRLYVDSVSGKLPTEYTVSTKQEVFSSKAIPKDYDDVHVAVRINRLNGKLANDQTPQDLIETRVYTVLHSEQPDRPNWENPVRAWAAAAGYTYPPTEQDDGSFNPEFSKTRVSFITPRNNEMVNPNFEVKLDVTGEQPRNVELVLEGQSQGEKSNGPYDFTVDFSSPGWKTLTAIVTQQNGEIIQSTIRIEVRSLSSSQSTNQNNNSFLDLLLAEEGDNNKKNKKR
ncbi:MAG TPA: PBP1A family penicillin-binding protein [Candidatus Binatia bacterium]|nr:PBP1A family penicillin-binding protein [Candidatus Binatia bacterium]